ncbi:hypothetical protein GIB67_011972, partial [Kingdonia uniflora]
MAIGQLIECIMGKVAAHGGKEGDATPSTDVTVDNISRALHNCEYQMHGFETMYNGSHWPTSNCYDIFGSYLLPAPKTYGRFILVHKLTSVKEKLFDQSDAYSVHVCELCSLIAIANLKKNSFECAEVARIRPTLF